MNGCLVRGGLPARGLNPNVYAPYSNATGRRGGCWNGDRQRGRGWHGQAGMDDDDDDWPVARRPRSTACKGTHAQGPTQQTRPHTFLLLEGTHAALSWWWWCGACADRDEEATSIQRGQATTGPRPKFRVQPALGHTRCPPRRQCVHHVVLESLHLPAYIGGNGGCVLRRKTSRHRHTHARLARRSSPTPPLAPVSFSPSLLPASPPSLCIHTTHQPGQHDTPFYASAWLSFYYV